MPIRRAVILLLIPVLMMSWIRLSDSEGQERSPTNSTAKVPSPKRASQPPTKDKDEDKDKVRQNRKQPLSSFMQQKLNASSRILEGLMVEDYQLIEDNAEKLLGMSREEKWRASNDMMYLQHSQQFRNAVDELRKKAVSKSTDGASLAWINVTMSCIQCHQWVRNIALADLGTVPE